MNPVTKVAALCFVSIAGVLFPQVHAQVFPQREVRIVVPYSPGGSSDVVARHLGAGLQRIWGGPVSVQNRPGAAGNIGSLEVVRSQPDGHTLLLQNDTMLTNLVVQGQLPYHHENDLTPIALLGATPLALVAHPSVDAHDLNTLVALGTQRKEPWIYGSCGTGSPAHFVMEMVRQKREMTLVQIGYRGCSPAVIDVTSGQIPLAMVSANLVVPMVKAGRLKALGISSAHRYRLLPDVPTFAEQGLQPFDISTWKALMGPAGLQDSMVARIPKDVDLVMADPEVQEALQAAGIEVVRGDAAALRQAIRDDLTRYLDLARRGA